MALTRLRGAGITANAITAAAIAPGAVDIADISDSAITTAKIANNAIETGKIADANVTTAKIAENAIETGKIADANVTVAKISITSDLNFNSANLVNVGIKETIVSSSSNVVLLNFANSAVFTCNLQEASALTPNNIPVGGCVMLLKLSNGGDHTVTYAGNPRFAANTAPTLTAAGLDFLYFTCASDTNYLVTPYADIQQAQ